MLKILQDRLQQYVNHELPDIKVGFRKGRGTRDQIANTHWIIKKVREFQKNIYFCFIDKAKAFDCVDHKELWKILTAAAAKSLQSYLTLGDPVDCSLPGFSVHGILQARILEWVAIAFSERTV